MRSDGGDARLPATPLGHTDAQPLFVARTVTVAAGCELPYERGDWADAIVLVQRGELELECLGGTRACFATGALLCFDCLPLRTMRAAGGAPAHLIAISRFSGDR
jgi:hypothetical protein